jgi:hypothetical protein
MKSSCWPKALNDLFDPRNAISGTLGLGAPDPPLSRLRSAGSLPSITREREDGS